MAKYIVQLMMLFIFCNARAMEMIKQDPSVPCNGICYLNKLPAELLNYIASFLMESEEEFIARTRIKKETKIPEDCCEFLVNYGFHSALDALCPDETKALLCVRKLELLSGGDKSNVNDRMIIIDRQKNNNNDQVMMYTERLDNFDECICLALSRGNSMIALFSEREVPSHRGENCCQEPFLEIQKIDVEKNEEGKFIMTLGQKRELLPLCLEPTWIGFNKQGTHLIAHGKDCSVHRQATYTIFPLKMVDANQPHVVVETKNKLKEYLRDKLVCNKYIEGTK